MRTGTPRMRTRSSPCPYAYGDPRMRTAVPICILSHMGIKSLISHMRTNPVCIWLVTEQSPYAYGDCHYDRIHTGICLQSITIRVRGFQSSPYAYGGTVIITIHTYPGAHSFPFVTQAHLSKPITVCIRGDPVRIRAGTATSSHTGSPSTHNEIVRIR
jgi:hypothetical protein